MMRTLFLFTLLVLGNLASYCQVGIGTTTPDPSSILEIQSLEKGILIPKINLQNVLDIQLDGINNAVEGLLIYNVNAAVMGGSGNGFYYFTGTQWKRLALFTELDDDWADVGSNIERQAGDVYIGDTNATNSNLYLSGRLIDWDDPNYYMDPAAGNKVNEIEFDDGSPSDPSIRFDDTTTGFYSPATDVLGYSINSGEVLRIASNGSVGIKTTDPIARLDVADSFKLGLNGSIHSGMFSFLWDMGSITLPQNSSIVLSYSGTATTYGIPQQCNVSVSFDSDLGNFLIVQHVWMAGDSVNIRMHNFSGSAITLNPRANLLFVW